MRIRKDSLIPEKLKNTGLRLFEVIRCKKPENPSLSIKATEDAKAPISSQIFDFSGLKQQVDQYENSNLNNKNKTEI